MDKSLLIIGAGIYGRLTKEMAESMGCYNKISFIDDNSDSKEVVGRMCDLAYLCEEYENIIVAIGNPDIREAMYAYISELPYKIDRIISPRAFVAASAAVGEGCIVEPMAVINSECKIGKGCIISAGAVINHGAVCEDVVHIDCNATVEGFAVVNSKVKVPSGAVYKRQI